jgi:hypothetical protein
VRLDIVRSGRVGECHDIKGTYPVQSLWSSVFNCDLAASVELLRPAEYSCGRYQMIKQRLN